MLGGRKYIKGSMMFDWLGKSCMEATIKDEICGMICIVVTLGIIYGFGMVVYWIENKYGGKKK